MDVTKPDKSMGFGDVHGTLFESRLKPVKTAKQLPSSAMISALCFCVGPAAPAGGGRERPVRRPIQPGRAGNPHPRPGPKENPCGWNRLQIRQIPCFDEIDATSIFVFSRGWAPKRDHSSKDAPCRFVSVRARIDG